LWTVIRKSVLIHETHNIGFKPPMHLGLIDEPFVPHNLIATREGPVPLLKFQMAPRLKILMSSGSKKGTQIYFILFSQKSRQMNPLQVPK